MSPLSAGLVVALLVCVDTPVIAQQTGITQGAGTPQAPPTPQGTGTPQAPPTPQGTSTPQAPATPQDRGAEQLQPGFRGNGALFGGADRAAKNQSRALDLSLSLSSAYDDDLTEGRSGSIFQPRVGGEFSDGSAILTFARKAPHLRMSGRAATSVRHYPSLGKFVGSSHSAGTDVGIDLSRRTTLQGSVDGAYVSEFAFDTISRQSGLGNAALVSTGLDITALDGARLSYSATTGLTRKVGLRSVLTLNLGTRESERRMLNEFADEKILGGHFARSVGRNTSVGFGYSLRSSSQRLGRESRPSWGQEFQVAIEHGWRHSRDRRTVFSVAAGPSLLRLPAQGQTVSSDRIGLVGSVALSHDMGRSWNLGTSYRRGAGSVDGLQFDTATLDLHGLLSRRADVTISTGYSRTDMGLAIAQSRYNTAFGSSRLQFALTRAVALYGEYVLYDYDVGRGMPLATEEPFQQHRRGVRGGVTFWMPLHEGR
jgi:hypothetical protein